MNLGIFLPPGDSLTNMAKSGQDDRFIKFYLTKYCNAFKKIYIFSYEDDKGFKLLKNVIVIYPKLKIHRLIYAFFLPIINRKYIMDCDVIRGLSLASSLSAILLWKPFVVNWAYDYIKFSRDDKKYLYIPLYFILEKIAFLKSKKVFIATKSKLTSLNNPKFIYLPNGVNGNFFKKTTHKNNPIFIGRLEAQKNLFFLLNAISLLPKNMRSIIFVGRGILEDDLVNYAKIKKIVLKIIEKVPNTKLPEFLKDYSVLLLTSKNEGSSKVLLESMALGLVPLVTDFDTAKDVIDDKRDGFILEYDINKYAAALEKLLTHKNLRNKMSFNASNKILKEFNLERQIKMEVEVLKSV